MPTLHASTVVRAFVGLSLAAVLPVSGCGEVRSDTLTQHELDVLTELDIGADSPAGWVSARSWTDSSLSLVAGDRIAFECAIAGGYFDLGDDAPVYANVRVSGYE